MIIVANKSGQLANRLFLFAHLVAFAAEHGITVANLSFDEYCIHFDSTKRDLFCRYPSRSSFIKPTKKRRHRLYGLVYQWIHRFSWHRSFIPRGMEILEIELEQICRMEEPNFQSAVSKYPLFFLCGWHFQDMAAFKKHSDTIRRFFEPLPSIQKNVSALIGHCRQGTEVIIGVHIRRGDYKDFMGGQYFYDHDKYAGLMHRIESLLQGQKVLFLICSNEPIPTEVFDDFNLCLGNNHLVEDLYSLAQCDYLIGPPSTYTMWASFYGQVPLYRVLDLSAPFSLDEFSIHNGWF